MDFPGSCVIGDDGGDRLGQAKGPTGATLFPGRRVAPGRCAVTPLLPRGPLAAVLDSQTPGALEGGVACQLTLSAPPRLPGLLGLSNAALGAPWRCPFCPDRAPALVEFANSTALRNPLTPPPTSYRVPHLSSSGFSSDRVSGCFWVCAAHFSSPKHCTRSPSPITTD